MGGLSIASRYGQHIEDGLNFACIAFMDGLFLFCFLFVFLFVSLFFFFFFFSSGSRSGFSTVNMKKSIVASYKNWLCVNGTVGYVLRLACIFFLFYEMNGGVYFSLSSPRFKVCTCER